MGPAWAQTLPVDAYGASNVSISHPTRTHQPLSSTHTIAPNAPATSAVPHESSVSYYGPSAAAAATAAASPASKRRLASVFRAAESAAAAAAAAAVTAAEGEDEETVVRVTVSAAPAAHPAAAAAAAPGEYGAQSSNRYDSLNPTRLRAAGHDSVASARARVDAALAEAQATAEWIESLSLTQPHR